MGGEPPDPVYILRGPKSPVTCVTFPSSEPYHLYSGNQNGQVNIWDLHIRRIASSTQAHKRYSVLWMDRLLSGNIITQGRDGQLLFWDVGQSNWKQTGLVTCGSLGFCSGCFVDGQSSHPLLAVPATEESVVNIFDSTNKQLIHSLNPVCEGNITRYGMCMAMISLDSNGSHLPQILAGYENGIIALWDIRKVEILSSIEVHTESVMCLSYSPSGRGVSGSVDTKLLSWTISDGCKLLVKHCIQVTNPGFNDIMTRHDEKIVATAGWDSQIRIFGAKKLKPLAVLSYHRQSVQCLAFSRDFLLAAGSRDEHISLWDIYT